MMTLGDLPCDKEQRTDWQVAAVIDLSEFALCYFRLAAIAVGGPAQIAPGLLVLIMIEVANVLFAVDSIPAIFGIMASLRNS
jgi:predicted tellurium resistance membrane protein TerC